MNSKVLTKIRSKMTIYAQRRAINSLDGGYRSIFKGRSMDFEDLRDYVIGDDIKDIDWKATARNGQTLVRRYIAERKHNIMIVADIGNKMSANALNGEFKSDVALAVAEVISYIVHKHGDFIGLIAGNKSKIKIHSLKQSAMHIERMLYDYRKLFDDVDGDMPAVLNYISRKFRKRTILFVITDSYGANEISDDLLKRIAVRHEQMFIIVKDANITDVKDGFVFDMDAECDIPKFIRQNKSLMMSEIGYKEQFYSDTQKRLRKKGVSSVIVGEEKEIVNKIIELLEGHKNGKFI